MMTTTTTEPVESAPAADVGRIVEWLADHDESCPVCGYNLRGLAQGQCPECGAPIRLTIDSPRLNPGPWALALTSCALGGGFDTVVTILFVGGIILAPPGPRTPMFFYMLPLMMGVAAVVTLTGLVWVYLTRARWARRSLSRQWALAWGVFVTVGLAHLVLGLLIFSMLF